MKRAVFALCAALALATTAFAQSPRVVLKGYDPVAYFTEGKPVKGDPRFSHDWDEGRYLFASASHRDMFAADPDRFAPQFGGYCTGSMSRNVLNEADPEAFVIREGKLYFFGATKFKTMAESDPEYIPAKTPAAAQNWEQRRKRL
jgi:hypothetical protein